MLAPWGWGAVLTHNGSSTHWASGTWDLDTLSRLVATVGDSGFQSLWECVASLIALELWVLSNMAIPKSVCVCVNSVRIGMIMCGYGVYIRNCNVEWWAVAATLRACTPIGWQCACIVDTFQ